MPPPELLEQLTVAGEKAALQEVGADGHVEGAGAAPDIHSELAALPRPRKHYQWYYSYDSILNFH